MEEYYTSKGKVIVFVYLLPSTTYHRDNKFTYSETLSSIPRLVTRLSRCAVDTTIGAPLR
jgi:hypothetical protein